jgi:hypothetical protein
MIRKMLDVFLSVLMMFFNCDVVFKITHRLKINKDNLKFNSDFKNYIIVEKIIRKH